MNPKEDKRQEILNAALRVITETGLDGVKMEDIAKEAGIGKGTIYEYFESKNELLMEMFCYTAEKYQKSLIDVITQGDYLLEKLRNLSMFFTRLVSVHLDIFSSQVSCQALPADKREQMLQGWLGIHRIIETMVREKTQSGEIRSNLDPEMVTSVIIGALKQYAMKKIIVDRIPADEIDHEGIAKVILTGLIW